MDGQQDGIMELLMTPMFSFLGALHGWLTSALAQEGVKPVSYSINESWLLE